jgi:hypothetical protein
MPNAIVQLSKFFWVVGSFGGVPSGSVFVKCYELHYQAKTVVTPKGERVSQYGCLNFHAKGDGGPKLSLMIKNKWALGWTRSWFYCRVPCRRCSEGGKSVFALHSQMSELDYAVEPEVECSDDDPNDATFIWAATTIGGRYVVEEYLACKMYLLAVGFDFRKVSMGTTPMSKVETPLPLFTVGTIPMEHASHVLAKVETEAERVLGSFGPSEYDALVAMNILNSGWLNRVFEQMGVPYAPYPLPGSKASEAAIRKWKAEVSTKSAAKKVKACPSKTPLSRSATPPPKPGPAMNVVKMARPKAKPRLRDTSEIEWTLVKPIGVSKKICLLDVAALPHGPHASSATVVCATRVSIFDNLGGDLSPDTRATPSLEGRIENRASSLKRTTKECVFRLPLIFGKFLGCACALRTGH